MPGAFSWLRFLLLCTCRCPLKNQCHAPRAASPCPSASTTFNAPFCSHPIAPVSGVSSSCYQNSCQQWGLQKAYDGFDTTVNSLAMTAPETAPFFQLDYGLQRSDISAVRLVSRDDQSWTQGNDLTVRTPCTHATCRVWV